MKKLVLLVMVLGLTVSTNGAADVQRPDTYFLQKAADRGLDAIAVRLDKDKDYLPYFRVKVHPKPELLHDMWDCGDMCGRYVDAFVLARSMTGSTKHVVEEQALRKLLGTCDPYENPFMATRMIIAIVDLYLADPTEENKKAVQDLAQVIRSKMTYEADYAYFIRKPAGWSSMKKPAGAWKDHPSCAIGGCMLALARYLQDVEDPELLDLIGRWTRFFLDHSGTLDSEGRYKGLTHAGGILTAGAGALRYGINVGDQHVIEKVRKMFDWTLAHCSSFGWVPDGLGHKTTSETCSIVDALHIAILLGRHVDSKYFDFVERCTRNQFLENQLLQPELVIKKIDSPLAKRTAKAFYGSWASWAGVNSHEHCVTHGFVEGCCLGSGIRGCYLVWDSAIEKRDGEVRVHLSFSRNSPWVEVVSYRPYQGRVDVLAHETTPLAIRIPPWVNKKDIRLSVGGKPVAVKLSPEGYVKLKKVRKGKWVRLEYPLRQVTIEEKVNGENFKARWRGDTVVELTPRGKLYPTYTQRGHMETGPVPMTKNTYQNITKGSVQW